MGEAFPAEPENKGRDGHQDTRHAEGPVGAVPFQQPRREQHGSERAEIDGEIEPVENARQKAGIERSKLVAHVGRNAGLDAARAKRDHHQTGDHPLFRVAEVTHHRQRGVPCTIYDREPDDDFVFPEKHIREDRADDGRDVERDVEKVHQFRGARLVHPFAGRTVHQEKILAEEDGEDRLHAVEGEPLCGLVADDVRDAARHAHGFLRLRAVLHGWKTPRSRRKHQALSAAPLFRQTRRDGVPDLFESRALAGEALRGGDGALPVADEPFESDGRFIAARPVLFIREPFRQFAV